MSIDIPTLFLVATFVSALIGTVLLVLWLQDRSAQALGFWALAYLIGGVATALWLVMPDRLPEGRVDIASAMLFLCCGLIWTGARVFHGRAIRPFVAIAGAVFWLVASQMTQWMDSDSFRIVVSSIVIATYAVLTASELQRERRRTNARGARAFVIPCLHGVIFLTPILTTSQFAGEPGASAGWFSLFVLLTLLYVIGTAFTVMLMAKEHVAQAYKTAANTDHLTGLFNRRGFFEAADKLIARQRKAGQSITVMVFDLDHFKSINDRFGHDAGDEALRAFATTASTAMRTSDIIGRLGGEEFVAILPGAADTALIVGERVRAAFEVRGAVIGMHAMNATVSIGAAEARATVADIPALLGRADAALYAAKKLGRNRVCTESDIGVTPPAAIAAAALKPALTMPAIPAAALP